MEWMAVYLSELWGVLALRPKRPEAQINIKATYQMKWHEEEIHRQLFLCHL
jgi:hypothetical protein